MKNSFGNIIERFKVSNILHLLLSPFPLPTFLFLNACCWAQINVFTNFLNYSFHLSRYTVFFIVYLLMRVGLAHFQFKLTFAFEMCFVNNKKRVLTRKWNVNKICFWYLTAHPNKWKLLLDVVTSDVTSFNINTKQFHSATVCLNS